MTQEWFESVDPKKKETTDKTEKTPVSEIEVFENNVEAPDAISDKIIDSDEKSEISEVIPVPQASENTEEEQVQPTENKSQFIPDQASIDSSPSKIYKLTEWITEFWIWLVLAIKRPTTRENSDRKNLYRAFATLTSFYTITIFFLISHFKQTMVYPLSNLEQAPSNYYMDRYMDYPLDFFAFISILTASALFLFSIILGTFIVKRFIYQDNRFTMQKTLHCYSGLFAINIILTAITSFFAFFGSIYFAIFLFGINLLIFLVGIFYTLSQTGGDSVVDSFYKFLLAVLVNAAVMLLFYYAEIALVIKYLSVYPHYYL